MPPIMHADRHKKPLGRGITPAGKSGGFYAGFVAAGGIASEIG
jgi:hypothetical protein